MSSAFWQPARPKRSLPSHPVVHTFRTRIPLVTEGDVEEIFVDVDRIVLFDDCLDHLGQLTDGLDILLVFLRFLVVSADR